MNFLSFPHNSKIIVFAVICTFASVFILSGCYSFTGASVPPHLKTLEIPTSEDNSGFGNATYRDLLTQALVRKFRTDNSFSLTQEKPDARLKTAITAISDITSSVRPGEVEKERKLTVTVRVEYLDIVKKKTVWEKSFSQFQTYDINSGVSGREEAVRLAVERIGDDILLAVVSGW